jgi:membrane protease YdiL (CAAX protease family)
MHIRSWPWGELNVVAGIWLGALAYIVPLVLIGPTAKALGAEPHFSDIGDIFEKSGEVALFSRELLAAAAADAPRPEAPRLLGDATAARVAWVYGIASASLFSVIAVVATRQRLRVFIERTGLDRFDFDRLWVPAGAVAVMYLVVGLYTQAADALGWEVLVPAGSSLDTTLRDPAALALYGITTVIFAPLGEELFYRGLAFSGLAAWGFLPAALISSAIFAISHFDAGSLIPFTALGMVMAWLYWRSGSLWDAIVFHCLFNSLTFILLVARIS